MQFALDQYRIKTKDGVSRPGWEIPEDYTWDVEKQKELELLYRALDGSRMSLFNSMVHAIDNSKFKNDYRKNQLVDDKLTVEFGNIKNFEYKEKSTKAIENGYVIPRFSSSDLTFYYTSRFEDKNGETRDLENVELAEKTYYTNPYNLEEEKIRLKNSVNAEYRKREDKRSKVQDWYAGNDFNKLLSLVNNER